MKKQIVKAVQKDFADDIYISVNEDLDQEKVDIQELKKTEENY